MHRKSLFLVGSLASVLVIGGYFALRKVPPPVATQKQAEVTLESTASGIFSELARSGDGRLLAIVKDGKEIGTWDRLQGGPTVRLFESDEKEWLYSPTFSPDGSVLATISNTPKQQNAGHLLLWDSATGQRLASVDDISWPVCCASFNPVGTLIAVAGNTTLYLVDPSTREIVHQQDMERVLNGVIQALAFNPSGDLLATTKRNGKVELWQVPDLNLIRTFSVGSSVRADTGSGDSATSLPAVSVAFAHKSPRLAANTSEGRIFIWDVNTGQEVLRYPSNPSSTQEDNPIYASKPNSLFFTLDDHWLVTMDEKTNGVRLLGTERHKETENVLGVPKHGVLETLNASSNDGSVAFSYRVFHPGEPGPPTAKVEIWSLRLR